ncbi:DUF4848 domain-containing protein [Hugenholtzia roseola]|uniref:DUF4848 domain-containing protein n=1 Tax=Hugenholtzia roseola TaxID=1002 RepID=UPI00042A56C9|nr:DUF4848 domain-containing protein [Hugenholtzia roseola]
MNLKSQIQGISLMFLLTFLFVSCSPEEIALPSNAEKSLRQEDVFLSPQGWLVFKDDSIFSNLTEKLHQMPRTEIETWEKSIGFTSLNSIYEQAIDEQESYCAQFEQASPEQIRELIASNKIYAPFVETHKELFSFNDDKTFDMNVALPFFKYGKVLNTSNLVQVGKEIRMYHQDMYKVLIDGDLAKIDLLISATETDEEKGIFVSRVIMTSSRDGRVQEGACVNTSNGESIGSEKVEGEVRANHVHHPTAQAHERKVFIRATNKIKSPIIGWNKKRTHHLQIYGAVYINDLFGMVGVQLNFSHNTMNNLKAEIYEEPYKKSGTGYHWTRIISVNGQFSAQGRGNTFCSHVD